MKSQPLIRHCNWTYGARTKSMKAWAEQFNMPLDTLRKRIKKLRRAGLVPNKALTIALETKHEPKN